MIKHKQRLIRGYRVGVRTGKDITVHTTVSLIYAFLTGNEYDQIRTNALIDVCAGSKLKRYCNLDTIYSVPFFYMNDW